jgi:hypothetical protein
MSDEPIKLEIKTISDKGRSGRLSLENAVQVVQFITIAGGIFGAILFFRDDKELKHDQVRLQQQQLNLGMMELRAKSDLRVSDIHSLRVSCRGPDRPCSIRFKLVLPNAGPTTMEVVKNEMAVFVAEAENLHAPDTGALQLRAPEDVGGLVSWAGPFATEIYCPPRLGGNTGTIRPGEETVGTYDYAVRVSTGGWVGVQSRLEIRRAEDDPDAGDGGVTVNQRVFEYCKVDSSDVWGCENLESADGGTRDGGKPHS